ncbi:MAG: hypothetical protein COA63_009625 [Methylophaga sp.]|nr:hypothetical protein [Methylophaga sp.]
MEKKIAAWLVSLEKAKKDCFLSAKPYQERQYALHLLTDNERDELFSIVLSKEEKDNCDGFKTFTDKYNEALLGAVITGSAKLADGLLDVMISSDMLIHHQLLLDAEKLIREKKHRKGRPGKDDSVLNYLIQIKAEIQGDNFSTIWASTFESLIQDDGKKMKARPPISTSMGTPMEVATGLVEIFDEYGVPPNSSLGTWLDRIDLTIEDIRGYSEKNNV